MGGIFARVQAIMFDRSADSINRLMEALETDPLISPDKARDGLKTLRMQYRSLRDRFLRMD